MAGVLGAASIPFIGCVALLVASILQVIATAAPYWVSDTKGDFGLWRRAECKEASGVKCYRYNMHWDVADWLDATRGLECLAIIFWSIPLVILPIYIYVSLGLYYRCLMGTMTAFTFIGAACNVVGCIIFGANAKDEEEWDLGYCFICCCIAFIFGCIAFIVFLVATCFRPKFAPERHFVSGFYVDPDRNRMYVVEDVIEPEPVKQPYGNGGQVNPAVIHD